MKITCFISLLLCSCFSFAQTVNKQLLISSAFAVDYNSSWSRTVLQQQKFHSFRQNDEVNIGYNKNAAVWCRFVLKNNNAGESVKTWLCFNNNHIDSLTLYDAESVKILGDRTTGRSPFIETLAFELNFKPGEAKFVWVRVKKETSFLDFTYSLDNQADLEAKSALKIALTSFFVGIVFLLLMINGILFLMTKDRLYVYYIGYSILTACYAAITTNFAKHVLFTGFRFFSEGRIYTGALWYIALSIFLDHFLNLRKNQPIKHKVVTGFNIINLSLIVISIALLIFYRDFEFRYFFVFGYIVFLASIILLFWSAVSHLKIERTQGIYALFAFLPQLVWGACLILKTFGIIPNSLGDNWMLFISLYEVFLFGYVLSRNYIDVFLKNNQLMEQVIFEKESSLKTISEVQLRERRNIANIIHDKVGSKIAHIIHLFDMKNTKLAKQTIGELAEDIRDISHKILPKALDDGALAASLQSQITSLNAGLTEAKIELFCYDFPEKINEPWVYDLYLIALELINNALKHGQAGLITIECYQYSNHCHFQFVDDGIGFDMQETGKGFGLENIEKRVNYYRGDFEINSVKNEGTIIQINIPIHH
jgi:signal transduction histidine kinase